MDEQTILRIAAIHYKMVSTDDGDTIEECINKLSQFTKKQIAYALKHRKRAKHNIDKRNKRIIKAKECGTCFHFNESNGKCNLTGKVAKYCLQHQTLAQIKRLAR